MSWRNSHDTLLSEKCNWNSNVCNVTLFSNFMREVKGLKACTTDRTDRGCTDDRTPSFILGVAVVFFLLLLTEGTSFAGRKYKLIQKNYSESSYKVDLGQ